MLNGDTFDIKFLDLPDDPFGIVLYAEKYRENFYKDFNNKETMCCNCHNEM